MGSMIQISTLEGIQDVYTPILMKSTQIPQIQQ